MISPYSRQFARHCQARCPYRKDLPARLTKSRYSLLHARSARATCVLSPAFGFIFGGAPRQSRDPLSADAAGASPTQEGGTCGACRETVASPHPRSHPQEAAGCSAPARLGNGRPRLLPTSGTRQPPPSVQGVRVGREENQSILGCPKRGLREDRGGCPALDHPAIETGHKPASLAAWSRASWHMRLRLGLLLGSTSSFACPTNDIHTWRTNIYTQCLKERPLRTLEFQRDSRRASSHCTKVSLEFESTSRA